MKVQLIGDDGITVHAEGELDSKKLATTSILIRNGRFYTYRHQVGRFLTTAVFQEGLASWDVTEELK